MNDGSHIFLHKDMDSGIWFSFGYSAFALRGLLAIEEFNRMSCYSTEMQMPCIKISNPDMLYTIVHKSTSVMNNDFSEITLYEPEKINDEYYSMWAAQLREEHVH